MPSRNRNPTPALLSAFVWPGAGQIYRGERAKGTALLVVSGVLAAAFIGSVFFGIVRVFRAELSSAVQAPALGSFVWRVLAAASAPLLATGVPLLALWIYGVADASRRSRESDADRRG